MERRERRREKNRANGEGQVKSISELCGRDANKWGRELRRDTEELATLRSCYHTEGQACWPEEAEGENAHTGPVGAHVGGASDPRTSV